MHEFKPSEIVSYYRDDESKIWDGTRIVAPGDLATDYPHAGVLSTTSYLIRYPTTATNRNRARSRWTYYHFLGLDIEKSAPRTTDPVALADTNNPTMHNPACTVCHTALDPLAGTFQDYGNEGYYRDQWGGMDSLDGQYKEGVGGLRKIAVDAATYQSRQTVTHTVWLQPGSRLAIRHYDNNGCGEDGNQTCGRDLRIDDFHVRDVDGQVVDRIEWSDLDAHCEYDGQYEAGSGGDDDHYRWWGWECHEIPVNVPQAGSYELRLTVWADQAGDVVTSFKVGANLYQAGDTWYRDMRKPGIGDEPAPNADNSLQWLAKRIVADPRFSEATVKFWWPSVMGSDVVEPPSEGDPDFQGRLLASNAQAAEVRRLAGAFRRGFGGGKRYNLKDLLTEVALSRWFRADSLADTSTVRTAALANAGARRLLTPEELSRKTVALSGFDWKRRRETVWQLGKPPNWTNAESEYGLLYGGIDSDGSHGAGPRAHIGHGGRRSPPRGSVVSCPIVMKRLLPAAQERSAAIRRFRVGGLADLRGTEFFRGHGAVGHGAPDRVACPAP